MSLTSKWTVRRGLRPVYVARRCDARAASGGDRRDTGARAAGARARGRQRGGGEGGGSDEGSDVAWTHGTAVLTRKGRKHASASTGAGGARGARRKNVVFSYSEVEKMVRTATSNEPWGAAEELKLKIADATYDL